MQEFHGEQLSFPPQTWKAQVQTCVVQRRWSKIHLKALIKGLIEEEQFPLNQHNLSNFWIIYINPHFVPPKKLFLHPLHPLQKNFGGSNMFPPSSPPCPFNILAQATGEVAVGHRRVEWRSEEFEVTAAADHRVQAQMHTIAAMALGVSDGESWSGTYK